MLDLLKNSQKHWTFFSHLSQSWWFVGARVWSKSYRTCFLHNYLLLPIHRICPSAYRIHSWFHNVMSTQQSLDHTCMNTLHVNNRCTTIMKQPYYEYSVVQHGALSWCVLKPWQYRTPPCPTQLPSCSVYNGSTHRPLPWPNLKPICNIEDCF